MIPKRIFYVWGANEKKPRDVQVCIQTWRQMMPDYEIIELNENDKTYFDYAENLKTNKWFKTVYENKLWAYVADYIRARVLYDHGGIYMDTDVSALKSFDKFLTDDAFVGMQDTVFTEPAILGAKKHNKFLHNIVNFYNKEIWELPIFTIPQIFEYFLVKNYNVIGFPEREHQKIITTPDITIYPEKYFIPFRCGSEFTPDCVDTNTHTIHWFSGSWTRESVLKWLKNKHINPSTRGLNSELVKTRRFSILWNKTVIKTKTVGDETVVYIMHIPLFKINKRGIYLFKFIRLFKAKS